MKIAVILALASAASAQTYSSHTGWSFTDTLHLASDIVVADITAGSAVDEGADVAVKATLHTVRVLSGNIKAGTDLTLEWRYPPINLPRAVTAKVPLVRGLWFLLGNDSAGTYQPLKASMMGPIGGFFLPLGDSAVAYPEIYPLQTKIAREIGTALEDLVREHGAELTAPAGVRPTRAPSSVATAFPAVPAPSRAGPNAQHAIPGPGLTPREQFQSSLHTLTALDQASVLDVYQSLSVLPDSSLRALGILGRLNAGDSSAAFELEKNLPSAVSAYNVVSFFPPYLGRLDLSHDPSAAHVLARIALSETTLPGFEAQLTYALASSHLPEMLPYLIVMLGSPDSGTRDSALRGFCELVGTAPVVPRHEELSDYCPNERLGYDRELEQEDAQFWIEWWLANRDAIARTVTLPNPTAPARYSVAVRQDKVNIAVETAFRFLLSSASHKRYDYYAVADGRISPVPSSASDDPHDVVSRHLGPVDYAVFHHVVESVNAKLAELGSQSQQIRNAARMAGVRPDFKQTQAISADRKAALRAGLAELESKLSADGWQTVERYLQSHGASTAATPVAK